MDRPYVGASAGRSGHVHRRARAPSSPPRLRARRVMRAGKGLAPVGHHRQGDGVGPARGGSAASAAPRRATDFTEIVACISRRTRSSRSADRRGAAAPRSCDSPRHEGAAGDRLADGVDQVGIASSGAGEALSGPLTGSGRAAWLTEWRVTGRRPCPRARRGPCAAPGGRSPRGLPLSRSGRGAAGLTAEGLVPQGRRHGKVTPGGTPKPESGWR